MSLCDSRAAGHAVDLLHPLQACELTGPDPVAGTHILAPDSPRLVPRAEIAYDVSRVFSECWDNSLLLAERRAGFVMRIVARLRRFYDVTPCGLRFYI